MANNNNNNRRGPLREYEERGALGAPTDFARSRAKELERSLSSKHGADTVQTPEDKNNQFEARRDPRVANIQQTLINRYHQNFITNVAEGRSGLNQSDQIGTGPRKTIDCLKGDLKYKGASSTTNNSRNRIQRMIDRGNVGGAIGKMKKKRFKKRPGAFKKTSDISGMEGFMGTQNGLNKCSKDNFKLAKEDRRLDISYL